MRVNWNKKDEKKIVSLWNKGTKIKDIVKAFPERTIGSVTNKIYRMQSEGILVSRHKDGKNPPALNQTKKGKKTKLPATIEEAMKKNFPYLEQERNFSTKDFTDFFSKADRVMEKDESSISIIAVVREIEQFLLSKNAQYGDSALNPIRVFSKADKSEQLKVRIDDKLNRLMQGNADLESDEDVIKDLIGYLILLLIHLRE